MMHEEQGSPDQLAQGTGPADLNGGPAAAQPDGAQLDSAQLDSAQPDSAEPGAAQLDAAQAHAPHADGGATGVIGAPPDAAAEPPGTAPAAAAGKKRRRSTWRELPILIVVALVIALVIKTYVVQPFWIPSSSMEDTLLVGDKVLVNKLVYHFRSVHPGDIIVFDGVGSWDPAPLPSRPSSDPIVRAYDATLKPLFHSIAGLFGTPIGQTDYIKRVIGVPGDDVACCNAQGLVTVNGVPLHESSYLYPGAAPSEATFNKVIPPGRLWVMGDNREASFDSRGHQGYPGGGTIPISQVIGRAFVIVWPPSQWRILPIPSTFSQPGICKSASASGQLSAAAQVLAGVKVQPEAPYVPLAAGFALALPLTWLQRRVRRRLTRFFRRPHRLDTEADTGRARRRQCP